MYLHNMYIQDMLIDFLTASRRTRLRENTFLDSLWLRSLGIIDANSLLLIEWVRKAKVKMFLCLLKYYSGLRAERSVFNYRKGQEIFPFSTASRPILGPTQPLMKWVPGTKLPGHEDDPSDPSGAEVNNGEMMEVRVYHHSPIRLYGLPLVN
jgi:hypothetical protein